MTLKDGGYWVSNFWASTVNPKPLKTEPKPRGNPKAQTLNPKAEILPQAHVPKTPKRLRGPHRYQNLFWGSFPVLVWYNLVVLL